MTAGAHDDDFLDLVAVLALGALPEGEARRVIAHLATCDACRTLYSDLRPAADFVGYAAEATSLDDVTSARMKARIMRVVRGGAEDAPVVRRIASTGWLAAAAAVILAVAIGVDDHAVRDRAARSAEAERTALSEKQTQLLEQQSQLAATKTGRDISEERLAALLEPGSKHFAVPQGEIVTSAGRVFIAIKLAALPRGKVYQAWTVKKGAVGVSPSLTFSPAASGVAFVELPVDASGVAAVAVSVEPTGGSRAPTSVPKFIRKLS